MKIYRIGTLEDKRKLSNNSIYSLNLRWKKNWWIDEKKREKRYFFQSLPRLYYRMLIIRVFLSQMWAALNSQLIYTINRLLSMFLYSIQKVIFRLRALRFPIGNSMDGIENRIKINKTPTYARTQSIIFTVEWFRSSMWMNRINFFCLF